ncbi:MAG: helix-turn-helix transcriptional regulator [Lachnospiraceae bacterium]
MSRPCELDGKRNLVAERLIELRKLRKWSQRDLAHELQLAGIDMDKNVITRIETNKRYVTDIELRALAAVFHVSYAFLIDGDSSTSI